MDMREQQSYNEYEADADYSDDSQEDPTFDVLEETRLTFSNLSVKRRTTKTNVVQGADEENEEDSRVIKMNALEFDEQDQKSYETIQKIIEAGQVDRLKVDQCKAYLRKHALRLTGKKDTLIQRIKEHIDIVNGNGEKKYPESTFVLNCKGDACTGDVVMFEQNVYEMFSVASRSANGPPIGTRVVAGRIVKESYGAAKQQHTFTIEVLWSKGEKPLPPLHPLLIKGRNLYRLNTMRQKWEDEGKRQKILSEKHARGGVARLDREARIKQKEMRKMRKPTRETSEENRKQEKEKRKPMEYASMNPDKLKNQPIQPENLQGNSKYISGAHMPPERLQQRQPLTKVNSSFLSNPPTSFQSNPPTSFQSNPPTSFQLNPPTSFQSHYFESSKGPNGGFFHHKHVNYPTARIPVQGHSQNYFSESIQHQNPMPGQAYKENQRFISVRSPLRYGHSNGQEQFNMTFSPTRMYSQQSHNKQENLNAGGNLHAAQEKWYEQKQKCRYYAQGRCYYEGRCKFSHDGLHEQAQAARQAQVHAEVHAHREHARENGKRQELELAQDPYACVGFRPPTRTGMGTSKGHEATSLQVTYSVRSF